MIACTQSHRIETMQDAGERLTKGRLRVGQAVGEHHKILPDDGGRDLDVLGIGTVQQVEVFTEVGLASMTVKAPMTWRRVGSDDAHPRSEPFNSRSHLRHHTGKLVAEGRRKVLQEHWVS